MSEFSIEHRRSCLKEGHWKYWFLDIQEYEIRERN